MRLADYYAAKGEAPGRWIGSGLVGVDGIGYGDVVTAEQMKNLFGDGCHPVTGAAWAGRTGGSVAGFDLTFSPVKSVSALWAVAPPEVARDRGGARCRRPDALAFIEREVLFTREGRNGARQVETRGLIATAFTHRDSRAGDPDLHTHVAVANKVQTRAGKWLSIYGKVLHEHVVAASETYNTALERHLSRRSGCRFVERPGAGGKRPVREIDGVDAELCERWSQRRADIAARQRELAREFTAGARPAADAGGVGGAGAAGEPGDPGGQARAAVGGRAAGDLAEPRRSRCWARRASIDGVPRSPGSAPQQQRVQGVGR